MSAPRLDDEVQSETFVAQTGVLNSALQNALKKRATVLHRSSVRPDSTPKNKNALLQYAFLLGTNYKRNTEVLFDDMHDQFHAS